MRLILILQCIIGLHSKSIDLKNTFAQKYIPFGDPLFIGLTRDFKNVREQFDIVVISKKTLYGKSKAACLWYENF